MNGRARELLQQGQIPEALQAQEKQSRERQERLLLQNPAALASQPIAWAEAQLQTHPAVFLLWEEAVAQEFSKIGRHIIDRIGETIMDGEFSKSHSLEIWTTGKALIASVCPFCKEERAVVSRLTLDEFAARVKPRTFSLRFFMAPACDHGLPISDHDWEIVQNVNYVYALPPKK